VADLLPAWVYKPLDKVRDTIHDTQRLDMIHLSARQRLETCNQTQDIRARRQCLKTVWADVLENLRILAGPV
jgi:hypothetical protein